MRVIPKDKVIFHFNTTNEANYTVNDGEVFWVEVDISIMDCAVGPINVEGAMPGDTLCVEVMAIDPADHGIMVTNCGLGVLGERISEPDTKIIPVHDGFAHFSDSIKIPLTPMIGVMGVAPKSGEIHCAVPHDHGANMDTKMVKVGARVYFPVAKEGAGLAVGDMHACMGDGELSGTGIEIAGRMCLKVTVYKDRPIERPVIETYDGLYFLASRPTLEESVKVATADVTEFLMKKLNLNFPDAYRLMSATCDAQICEVVDDNMTVRLHCPKFDTRIQTL